MPEIEVLLLKSILFYLNLIFLKQILVCPKNSGASYNHSRSLVVIFKGTSTYILTIKIIMDCVGYLFEEQEFFGR